MDKVVLQAMIKASMMKEALASCQLEGIGLDLTLEDLYLAEMGIYKKNEDETNIVMSRVGGLRE